MLFRNGVFISAVVLLVASAAQSFDATKVTSFHTLPSEDPLIGNFHTVVSGKIYRGARLQTASQVQLLHDKYGINTIINLQGGDLASRSDGKPLSKAQRARNALVRHFEPGEMPSAIARETNWANRNVPAITEINIPLDSLDGITVNEEKSIVSILDILQDPQSAGLQYPIYVHCEHGADRTGLVVALYRVAVQGEPILQAREEMNVEGHNFWHLLGTFHMDLGVVFDGYLAQLGFTLDSN